MRTVAQRMVEVLLDTLTTIGLALNEMDYDSKYELLTSVFVQMRMVKTCIDTLKEWSSKSIHTRIISNRQMPQLCEKLEQIQNQLAKWRSSVVGKRPPLNGYDYSMRAFSIENGRVTGTRQLGRALVKNKIVHAITASNHWASTENSSNNAWNVNFGSGNFNNNNKYNSNVVRAVAALPLEYAEGWFEAFDDCCRRKRMSTQCILYRLWWDMDLLNLARSVYDRTYNPTTSICFITTLPKLREVFAANFRDRIVQHWLCLRLEPLFEQRFESQNDVSYNCRKGFGVQACVERVAQNAIKVSENYTKDAYYYKGDLKGFFMSIDCTILLDKLLIFIKENWSFWGDPAHSYYARDLDAVLWLAEVIIRHRPQDDCIRQGNTKLWDELPHNKSLFYAPYMTGEPIGNLTSQLFANFYMSFFDEFALAEAEKLGAEYVRFVDDFVFVCKSERDCIYLHIVCEQWLKDNLNVILHPDKIYIQHVTKGVPVVGSWVKPGRLYLSNRTVGHFYDCMRQLEWACAMSDKQEILRQICRANSLLGFLRHHATYGIRSFLFRKKFKVFWRYCWIKGHLEVIKPCKKRLSCI